MVGSSQGGVNIEEVARTSPDAIIKDAVDIMDGEEWREEQHLSLCFFLTLFIYSFLVLLYVGLSMEQAVKMAEKIGFPTSLSQAVHFP